MGMYDYLDKYNAQTLQKSALSVCNNLVDKREGSVIYDTLYPCSVIQAALIQALKTGLLQTDIQTATGDWLDLICSQLGVYRRQAIASQRVAVAIPNNIVIEKNQSFETKAGLGFIWKVTQILGGGNYVVTCQSEGADGNVDYGELKPIDYIEGLESMQFMDSIIVNGVDKENDLDFRIRYWEELKSDAYGGNFSDYKNFVFNLFAGDANGATLDGMMFFPASNIGGGGLLTINPTAAQTRTVQNSFYSKNITESYLPANPNICTRLKAFIDPISAEGLGAGLAPAGHKITISPPTEDVWHIYATVDGINTTQTFEELCLNAEIELREYFQNVRKASLTRADSDFPFEGYWVELTIDRIKNAIIGDSRNARFNSIVQLTKLSSTGEVDITTSEPFRWQNVYNNATLPILGSLTITIHSIEEG